MPVAGNGVCPRLGINPAPRNRSSDIMPSAEPIDTILIERRSLRWLLLFYSLFILYGTFIPFRFNADAGFVQAQWARFFAAPYAGGVKQFSLSDVVSNIFLFVPFGFLWIGSDLGKKLFSHFLTACFVVGALGGLFGLAIEIGQLYSPGRTSSLLDAVCNGSGAALGGAFGYGFFRLLRGRLGLTAVAVLRRRPSLLLLGACLCVYAIDAFYPFDVTLDVSTLWDNFKHARWVPFVRGAERYWLDLVVEKALLFAVIGYLARANLQKAFVMHRNLSAALGCVAAAFVIEAGKLFFAGRSPNTENFLLAALGALLGVVAVYPLARTAFCRRAGTLILMTLNLLVIAWSEWAPFDWIGTATDLSHRLRLIEWLPFSGYYGADPRLALFDLLKKFVLVGPLGFLIARRSHEALTGHPLWRATITGLVVGVFFEAVQIALRARTPSVTDVLLFGGASWFGAWVGEKLE